MKAIIWDWGRTLYQSDEKIEFPEAEQVLQYCQNKGYRMVTVSLVSPAANANLEERKEQIEESSLRKYFEAVYVTANDKEAIFEQAVKNLGLPRKDIWIIGDRMKRDISYAKKNGHPCVWIQKGKFADELPDETTGQPDYIINHLEALKSII